MGLAPVGEGSNGYNFSSMDQKQGLEGNLNTHELTHLREGMRLITREANSNLNIEMRHLSLFKDLVFIVGKVREHKE